MKYTTIYYDDSDTSLGTMLEASHGTRGGISGRKWYVCSICGLEFPEDEVVKRSGKIYCEDDFEDFIADKVKRR
jgi:hypothetical protein